MRGLAHNWFSQVHVSMSFDVTHQVVTPSAGEIFADKIFAD
jgi:hypothetical protein